MQLYLWQMASSQKPACKFRSLAFRYRILIGITIINQIPILLCFNLVGALMQTENRLSSIKKNCRSKLKVCQLYWVKCLHAHEREGRCYAIFNKSFYTVSFKASRFVGWVISSKYNYVYVSTSSVVFTPQCIMYKIMYGHLIFTTFKWHKDALSFWMPKLWCYSYLFNWKIYL